MTEERRSQLKYYKEIPDSKEFGEREVGMPSVMDTLVRISRFDRELD